MIVCTSTLLYFTFNLLALYLEHQTRTIVNYFFTEEVTDPDISICTELTKPGLCEHDDCYETSQELRNSVYEVEQLFGFFIVDNDDIEKTLEQYEIKKMTTYSITFKSICYTFNISKLGKNYKYSRTDARVLNRFYLIIKTNTTLLEKTKPLYVKFNTAPEYGVGDFEQYQMENGYLHHLTWKLMQMHYAKPPYKSNCSDYEQYNTRANCTIQCYKNAVRNINRPIPNYIIGKYEFDDEPTTWHYERDVHHQIEIDCQEKCKQVPCEWRFYSIVEIKKEPDRYNATHVLMYISFYPDLEITYLPLMTTTELFWYLVSFVGWWLGLSAPIVFDEIFRTTYTLIISKVMF